MASEKSDIEHSDKTEKDKKGFEELDAKNFYKKTPTQTLFSRRFYF